MAWSATHRINTGWVPVAVGRACRLRLAAVVNEVAVCPDWMVEKEGPYLLLAACHLLHPAAAVAYPYRLAAVEAVAATDAVACQYRMLVGLAYLLLHPAAVAAKSPVALYPVYEDQLAAEESVLKGYSPDGLAVTLSSASYLADFPCLEL